MSFVRNMASTFAVSLIAMPVAFVTSVVLTRTLSIEQYGLYGLVMTLGSTLGLVGQFGLPVAAIYAIRRLQLPPARVVGSALTTCAAIALAVALVCLAAREPISTRFLDGAGVRLLLVALVVSACQLLGASFSGVARAIDRFDVQNRYSLLETTSVLVGAGLLLWLWEPTLRAAVTGMLIAQLGAVLWIVATVVASTGWAWDPRALLASTAGFAVKAWLQQLMLQAHERIGVFLLAYHSASSGDVAPFLLALGLVRIVKALPTAIALALFPQLAGFERPEAVQLTARAARHSLLWLGLACLVLVPAGFVGIPLVYGEDYRATILPFVLLLPSTAGLTISQIVSRYFVAFDLQWTVIRVGAFAVLVNLLLNLWLIPRHGVLGAAVASLVSYTLEAVLTVGIFVWRAGARPRLLLFDADDLRLYVDRARPWLRRLGALR